MDTSREGDQSLERLLRQSLSQLPDGGMTEACLDAETMAAWADGGLSDGVLEAARLHAADCARCQALMGQLSRINAVAPPVEPQHTAPRWLGWLMPLAAVAAAVVLWVAVPRDTGERLPQTPEVQRPAEKKAQDAAPFARSLQPAATGNDLPVQAGKKDADQSQAEASVEALKEETDNNQPPASAQELRRDAGRLETDSVKQQSGTTVGGISPSATVVPAPAAPGAPVSSPLAEKVAGGAETAARSGSANRFAFAAIEILSPDPSVRWRIAGSVVQRSSDAGARWETTPTGISTELTAGSAPTTLVCWLVGRGGVVLLSTDGRTWHRLPFPEMTDLSAVRAQDARAAYASTVDGRTFSTADGGATWSR